MRFLIIDTSTERGIIALCDREELLFERHLPFGNNQSKFLMPVLSDLLKPFGIDPGLDFIGVGIGPGSYTGIRIGVSAAQSLAYSWNIPLVGVCSLVGFVPSSQSVSQFAAILDARIAGVYIQKGWLASSGDFFHHEPQVLPIEEVSDYLDGITHFITPSAKGLQTKFAVGNWSWEEKAPSGQALMKKSKQNFIEGKQVFPPNQLDLLYLRKTEAERSKKLQN